MSNNVLKLPLILDTLIFGCDPFGLLLPPRPRDPLQFFTDLDNNQTMTIFHLVTSCILHLTKLWRYTLFIRLSSVRMNPGLWPRVNLHLAIRVELCPCPPLAANHVKLAGN